LIAANTSRNSKPILVGDYINLTQQQTIGCGQCVQVSA